MRRCAQILLLLLVFCQVAVASEESPTVTVDGEAFTKKFVAKFPNGDKLLEFVRNSDSFDNWTKLVGYRYQQLPGIGNDPVKYALAMGQIVMRVNPQARYQVLKTNGPMRPSLTF